MDILTTYILCTLTIPGVVYDTGDDETTIVLKGVVRAERLPEPTEFIPAIMDAVKLEYLRTAYGVMDELVW